MTHLDPAIITGTAAVIAAVAQLVWSFRRRR